MMHPFTKIGLLSFITVLISGCSTVANVAQSVADKARGETKSPEPAAAPTPAPQPNAIPLPAPNQAQQNSNTTAATTKTGNSVIDKCYQNFVVDGSYLKGYRFRTNTTLSGVSKADVFSKAVAATAEEGWIITASDAATGTISANHTRGRGNDARTQVMSISVISIGKDVRVSATLNTPPDLFGSGRNEESLKKATCEGIEKMSR